MIDNGESADIKAGGPPLIEAFGITGLYGYRTISLEAGHAATILIARNGSGKTTLLGALNAFLLGQYARLRGLEFETIFCKFRGMPDQLVLTRADLESALNPPDTNEFINTSAKLGVQPQVLFQFVIEEWPILRLDREAAIEHPIFSAFLREYGYYSPKVNRIIDDMQSSIYEQNLNISHIIKCTRGIIGQFEVLYLPTYRRVELAIRENVKDGRLRKKKSRIDFYQNGLFTGDIKFGLSDISDRLREINETIVYESNNQYRKISADIINDLIGGTYERADPLSYGIPKKEELELFFSRVEQGRKVGPNFPINVPNLDKIYRSDSIPESSEKFLNYFLGQLDRVIRTTKKMELRVQEFVDRCNDYLLMDEFSTAPSGLEFGYLSDAKNLVLNKKSLQVSVVSTPDGRKISLDALSSGEKQMISLFAKLFLYESPKIVLIDEPELSLSIEWQRKILVDVIESPMCEQLIAITHSPFVFDNQLDPFAGSLRLSVSSASAQADGEDDSSFDDDGFEE